MVGVRERERVKFKSTHDQRLEFSHIVFIFNPITRIDFHDCPKELFHDCRLCWLNKSWVKCWATK